MSADVELEVSYDHLVPPPPPVSFIDLWEEDGVRAEVWHRIREERPVELRLGGGQTLVYRRVES